MNKDLLIMHNKINYIVQNEIYFNFSKSHGHGGQNINKRKTKAELYFNVNNSRNLTENDKINIIKNAGHFIHHHESIIIMTCQEERYQHLNKKKVISHFKKFLSLCLS